MNNDLRSWIDGVRSLDLLREVHGADWDLEIGAITDLNSKKKKFALLFDQIKGYSEGRRTDPGG